MFHGIEHRPSQPDKSNYINKLSEPTVKTTKLKSPFSRSHLITLIQQLINLMIFTYIEFRPNCVSDIVIEYAYNIQRIIEFYINLHFIKTNVNELNDAYYHTGV